MNGGGSRAPAGGLIDRARRVDFRFDGRDYAGHPGDTLASALLANGVRLVGRSFKYHRPRGIFGVGAEEPNALVRVGSGARAEPNLKATQVDLYPGLEACSQNRWPSLDFDLGAVNDRLSRLLPAGFYYKTFMWPASAWMLYERAIRRMAGLGAAAREPDPDTYDKRHAHCEVLVVGAGPAGLAAALAAGRAGARVILVDEGTRLGGSLLGEARNIGGAPALEWIDRVREELESLPRVRVLPRATAFGYYDQNLVAVAERVAEDRPAPATHEPRQRIWWIRATRVVLATGAIERPLVFADNDRPGVMLTSAAATYARRYGVRAGERAVVFTNNDAAYRATESLAEAGVEVAAVVDARDRGPGEVARTLMAARGIEIRAGQVVTRARGARALTSVDLHRFDGTAVRLGREAGSLACDLLCVSGGFSPAVHLFSQSQGRLRYDETLAAFLPGESRQAERSAGAARGLLGLGDCLRDGQEAGMEAASSCGHRPDRSARAPSGDDPATEPLLPLWAVPIPGEGQAKRFVDLQNDVTAEDVGLATREGYVSVEHLKRYTTLGMGTDQGRTSNVNGLAILAGLLGSPIEAVGTTTFRPPYSPVTLGALAGKEQGPALAPVRRTPMQRWHEEAGARFVPAGPWFRPQCYPREGESLQEAFDREVLAVRGGVGIVDVSTLGKILVQGRDAAEFLERVYVNRWKNLPVGRCRYGLMLREDGFVFDDGTTARFAEHEYYMTTTTGHAAAVMSHLEYHAQTVWPELAARLTSVTDQWGGLALAGPRSREVLAAACEDPAVDDAALPPMGCLEARIGGMTVRIFRMSFSGERAYEIHAPADHALEVWEAVLEAGRPHGIVPYGMEAMGVMRIEKGFVTHAEINGTVTPGDLGFERLLRRDSDFIGRRALERPALADPARRQRLVGLVSEDGRHIPRGAQLVHNPTVPPPVPMLGYVTSTCRSPTLGREIALALLEGGLDRVDERLVASSPLTGRHVPVRVAHPVFLDPQGARTRG